MLIYQYHSTWKSFFIAHIIQSFIFAFIAEPISIWMGIYAFIVETCIFFSYLPSNRTPSQNGYEENYYKATLNIIDGDRGKIRRLWGGEVFNLLKLYS